MLEEVVPELAAGKREGVEGVEVEVGGKDSDDAVGRRGGLVSWQSRHPMAYG